MAHRGRLNVLANIMGKSPRQIFREFEDADAELLPRPRRREVPPGLPAPTGTTAGGRNGAPVALLQPEPPGVRQPGGARAACAPSRTAAATPTRERGLVLLIHGDAAFAGEGIVQETLNLSELAGYTTGGTLHVVVNNQIGFTTPPGRGPLDAPMPPTWPRCCRSPSSTSTARTRRRWRRWCDLALDFRRAFRRDVVIDMYCYRRRGHNEGDEPAFTQPLLYRAIEQRKPVREGYLEHLLQLGEVTRERGRRDRRASAASARSRSCRRPQRARRTSRRRRRAGRHLERLPRRARDAAPEVADRRADASGWPRCWSG